MATAVAVPEDQHDAASVRAPFDRVVGALADGLPGVAEQLDAARADVLASTDFSNDVVGVIPSIRPSSSRVR